MVQQVVESFKSSSHIHSELVIVVTLSKEALSISLISTLLAENELAKTTVLRYHSVSHCSPCLARYLLPVQILPSQAEIELAINKGGWNDLVLLGLHVQYLGSVRPEASIGPGPPEPRLMRGTAKTFDPGQQTKKFGVPKIKPNQSKFLCPKKKNPQKHDGERRVV